MVTLVSTVSTPDCDSVRMGSNPIRYPNIVDSTGVRLRLISSGDRLDGLKRLGSNPRSTTTTGYSIMDNTADF